MSTRTQVALVSFLLAGSAGLGLALAALREPSLPERSVENRPVQLSEDGYVSSQTCKACHPDQYSTWHASYHRTMTQVAGPATARANFDGVTVSAVHGQPMTLQRVGDQLWAEFDDPDSSESIESRTRVRRQVVMITGSHHQQVYWYATGRGRLLGQLPAAYLIREQMWIPRRAAVLHPPSDPAFSETGHWNSTCIACHATNGKPQFDTPFGTQPVATLVVDTTVAELGIACEACHGPAEQHVRANRNPLRRYAQHFSGPPDDTTTQPARLATTLSSQVCGQCHGIWEFYDRAGERFANSRGLPFRPGDELLRTRFVAQPTANAESPAMKELLANDPGFIRDSFWADGMVRVSGREYNGLLESPCFKSNAQLSCFSCHTMHQPAADPRPTAQWADDQLTAGMDGNQACLQCHATFRTNLSAHTRHQSNSSGSSCYNCHMPYTTYGLLKTIRSHTISNPSATESVDAGRPNACNLCHLDKTLAWTAETLSRWYGTPGVQLSADDQTIAASLQWLLKGDAGQRAIAAQAMGWPAAREASGTDWMAPHLATLLDDPYDAVRFIAARSLRSLPGMTGLHYDFVAPSPVRRKSQLQTMALWDGSRRRPGRAEAQLLMTSAGDVNIETVLRLLKERDNRRMLLRE